MKDYIMNRKSLRKHCEQMCKIYQKVPTSGAYSEHKFVLDLLNQTEWTPVSEGMPKKTDYYLIQYSRKICPDEMAVAFYDVEEKESDPNYSWEFKPNCGEYKEVIAWMPLPGKYKPESEVQNE